jgi:hypothetical protein
VLSASAGAYFSAASPDQFTRNVANIVTVSITKPATAPASRA